ncbi:MAG: hypothetical protein GJ676_19005 [Rhodobacteraceae bacterium]|nr:hypothetical protein [Paracoccaceae bacterium]
MKRAVGALLLAMLGTLPFPANADPIAETLSPFLQYFDVGKETASAPSASALFVQPWREAFRVSSGEEQGLTLDVRSCPALFAAREYGLEPDAPSEWPVYRGYALRCLALRELVFLGAAETVTLDDPHSLNGHRPRLPWGEMFPDLSAEDELPETVTFTSGVGTATSGTEIITLEIIASFTAAGQPNTRLLMRADLTGSEGTYSDSIVFVLEREAASSGYRVERLLRATQNQE